MEYLSKTSFKSKCNGLVEKTKTLFTIISLSLIIFSGSLAAEKKKAAEIKKPMSLQDIMKFRSISPAPVISENGDWVIYSVRSDVGNGAGYAYHIKSKKTFTIPRGSNPIITKNSKWIAMSIKPDALKKEKAGKDKKLKTGIAIFETSSGKITKIEKVKKFIFSDDSNWLVYQLFPEEKKDKKKKQSKKDKLKTYSIVLHSLNDGKDIKINNVLEYSLDPASRFIAYSVGIKKKESKKENSIEAALYAIKLKNKKNAKVTLHKSQEALYSKLIWSKKKSRLAFLSQKKMKKKNVKNQNMVRKDQANTVNLFIWDGIKEKLRKIISPDIYPEGWMLPIENTLSWSKDEDRLYFGLKPKEEYSFTSPEQKKKENKKNLSLKSLFDLSRLQEKKSVDVWHWQDPLINSHQKLEWKKLKNRTYLAVYHFKKGKFIQLADKSIERMITTENSEIAIGLDNNPYKREITWDGRYSDVYIINMKNGSKKKILTRFGGRPYLSNLGKFALYYKDKNWHLYNNKKNHSLNLTKKLSTPFYNEDHDYPSKAPSYWYAGWTKNDRSVIIYDKYDIWQFFTSGKVLCLTDGEGRKNNITFRIKKMDKEIKYFEKNEKLLLSGFSHTKKYQKFYHVTIGKSGLKELIKGEENKWFRFLAKAKKKNRVLYTRENFQEFPDLWISDREFKTKLKISNVNPQKKNFLWGSGEIVEWKSLDGIKLQGALFKPENFDKNKAYPVLIYYYRFMSQRVHRFNEIVINHRPCFPFYTGNDYLVFLPDIRFDIGRPGYSALKCLTPGVQKLISMGVANPEAIGIHGHSWSGYQTAHVITMTNIFKCAIAGAPVTNMTSAYNGIRWKSGLARQFQYEKSQSRIGRSLIDAPNLYIENSPVFFADRIQTPLLIQFGDKDGAVPWYQGIELYLTMRRLNKNCIFLQYNDEGHHLKKYSNKLDYTIKFKEYMDHYLKGKPAPEWMTKGVPYRKK